MKCRLWTGLSSTLSFLLVVAILAMNCLNIYSGTVNTLLGTRTSKVVNENGEESTAVYYESEYGERNEENLQKLIADTYEQSVREEEEGAVLLKNEKNTLPLSEEEKNVTLFGHAVVQPLYKGASAGSKGYSGDYAVNFYDAMKGAGFNINETLFEAYENSDIKRTNGGFDFATRQMTEWVFGEEDISFYTEELHNSWESDYNDVAIVMLARDAGEGIEMQMEDPAEGISQLALHQEEKDLLQMIKDSGKFEKTIVLLNTGWAMELGWLEEYDVDACVLIGLPGQRGFEGVANILTGEANPSGHITDTFAENSLSSPAVVNGGYNNQTWTNLEEVLEGTQDPDAEVSYYTVQAEGIYVGYKYYETRYEDSVLGTGNADSMAGSSTGEAWNYTDEVTYPFGYGLSYTSFEQSLDRVEAGEDEIQVQVTVTNTGTVAGKSVIQLYAQTPYGEYEKANKVEKSSIQLLQFDKTNILEPGESETLTMTCDKYLLTGYDYTNAKGYIMSEGQYYLSLGDDAHDALNNILAVKGAAGMVDLTGNAVTGSADKTYGWTESFDDTKYKTSQYTDSEVTNQFDDCNINYWVDDEIIYLSRDNWESTYPTAPTKVAATREMMEVLDGRYYEKPEDAPSVDEITQGENQGIPLAAMMGLDYDDTKWETYLDQFTIEELAYLLSDHSGIEAIESVGVPELIIGDGPDGIDLTFSAYGDDRLGCSYPCELILAMTFNKDLMERRGELLGEEYLYCGATESWAPGVNLHRTPFGGRNFEYFSEDGNMSYLCGALFVEGLQSKGVAAGGKHIIANDQEENRKGISTFFNEQAFREGALRAAEGAVAAADAKVIMGGMNRVGMEFCNSSDAVCTEVVVNEWGFVGKQITDAIGQADPVSDMQTHFDSSLAAGTDCYCFDNKNSAKNAVQGLIEENDDGNLLMILRNAAHDSLYVMANSAAMNGYDQNSTIEKITPWWVTAMYLLITALAVLDACSIIMLIRSKGQENNTNKGVAV